MKIKFKNILIPLLVCLLIPNISAQETTQAILNPNFKTLRVELTDQPLTTPIIALNSGQTVTISFDELAEDRTYLRYELIHCNADWSVDNLVDSEFLDGFNYGDIEDYAYSRATLIHYVHYSLTIPNEQVRPTVSGNYVVRVYPEDDPDETILRARFYVSEESMAIPSAEASPLTDLGNNGRYQQVSFTVDRNNVNVDDLYSDLYVVVTQNGRTDAERVVRNPLRVEGRKAVFDHRNDLIFYAGNEYRRTEFVSTNWPGRGVDQIVFSEPFYHFILKTDTPRSSQGYLYDQTQNGRFFIRNYDSTVDNDIEADYVLVHFALDYPHLSSADIYIEGDITGRRNDSSSLMSFNDATGLYEKTLLLKQGAYNYQYLTSPRGGMTSFLSPTEAIEGDLSPTINEYLILVYHRPRGSRYDRLVAAKTIFTH